MFRNGVELSERKGGGGATDWRAEEPGVTPCCGTARTTLPSINRTRSMSDKPDTGADLFTDMLLNRGQRSKNEKNKKQNSGFVFLNGDVPFRVVETFKCVAALTR